MKSRTLLVAIASVEASHTEAIADLARRDADIAEYPLVFDSDSMREYRAELAARVEQFAAALEELRAERDDEPIVDDEPQLDRIAEHEQWLGTEAADHLYPHGTG